MKQDKIDPRMGPIHGVHPKAKAIPIKNWTKKSFTYVSFYSFLVIQKFNIKNTNNVKSKIIIINPATILNSYEFVMGDRKLINPAPRATG